MITMQALYQKRAEWLPSPSTGSPFRLAWKIQIVASAVWLFRDHREIVRMSYKGNQTKRESDQSVARRRLADIESTAQDALTSWDTSAYHSFLFVNLVARSPLWDDGGGKNTTSARLMLERYLFWVSLAFVVGWMYRRYIRLKWNRRSTQRNIDKSSMILVDTASTISPWDMNRRMLSNLNKGNLPAEWDVLHAPDMHYAPRVESVVGMLVVIPGVLVCVAFASDVAEGYEPVSATSLIIFILAGTIVILFYSLVAISVYGASRSVPYIDYVKDSNGGGHWHSCRIDHSHFASRFGFVLSSMRAPKDDRDKRRLVAYAWLGPALMCSVAFCCAYGGSALADANRRGAGALGAGLFTALDAIASVVVQPLDSRTFNVIDITSTMLISAGFILHGVHFMRSLSGSSDIGISLHLAAVVLMALLEYVMFAPVIWAFVAKYFQSRESEDSPSVPSVDRNKTLRTASFRGDPVRIDMSRLQALGWTGDENNMSGIIVEDAPVGASEVEVVLFGEQQILMKKVPVDLILGSENDDNIQEMVRTPSLDQPRPIQDNRIPIRTHSLGQPSPIQGNSIPIRTHSLDQPSPIQGNRIPSTSAEKNTFSFSYR